MNKRLFRILSIIETIIVGMLGLLGLIMISAITYTWPMFFITKTIGIGLVLLAYWDLVEE